MSSKLMSESVSSISPTTALWGVSVYVGGGVCVCVCVCVGGGVGGWVCLCVRVRLFCIILMRNGLVNEVKFLGLVPKKGYKPMRFEISNYYIALPSQL